MFKNCTKNLGKSFLKWSKFVFSEIHLQSFIEVKEVTVSKLVPKNDFRILMKSLFSIIMSRYSCDGDYCLLWLLCKAIRSALH